MISFLLTTRIGRGISILIVIAAAWVSFKVWLVAHDTSIVREQTAKCDARLENMISQAEADALSAVLDQEQARRIAAEVMANEAAKRATVFMRVKEQQSEEIDRLTEAAKAETGLTYPSKKDMQWLNPSR